jgi:hypothetical protein
LHDVAKALHAHPRFQLAKAVFVGSCNVLQRFATFFHSNIDLLLNRRHSAQQVIPCCIAHTPPLPSPSRIFAGKPEENHHARTAQNDL